MLKAKSAETKYKIPSNNNELYRMKQKAWKDDRTLVVTKEQQAKLSVDKFNLIQQIGVELYGKDCK